jgi:putative acetyltransferase
LTGHPGLDDLKQGKARLDVLHPGHTVVLRGATPGDAGLLAGWRHAHRRWFLTEFPPDANRTRTWLTASIAAPDRLLLVVEVDGTPVAHLGLREIDVARGEAEVDNVVRGRADGGKGVMSRALQVMLSWAEQALGIRRVALQVFADNPARDFYAKIGFTLAGQPAALSFEGVPGEGAWRRTDGMGARELVCMELRLPVEPGIDRPVGVEL